MPGPRSALSRRDAKRAARKMAGAPSYQCYIPRGFITTLAAKRQEDDADEVMSKASRTSVAEAALLHAERLAGTNLGVELSRQAWVLRLNRGRVQRPGLDRLQRVER